MKQTTFDSTESASTKTLESTLLCEHFLQLPNKSSLSKNDLLELYNNHPSFKQLNELGFICNADGLSCFAHRSFIHEYPSLIFASYERLEFLGDAALELIVTEALIRDFPNLDEGKLSKFRSSLVNENSLYELSTCLNLKDLVLLGQGEVTGRAYLGSGILSDLFESMIGGMTKDHGIEQARNLFTNILNFFENKTGKKFIDASKLESFDAKTKLQELTTKLFKVTPEYHSSPAEGEGFIVEIRVKGELLLKTVSLSKKKGEHHLAKQVLENNLLKNIK